MENKKEYVSTYRRMSEDEWILSFIRGENFKFLTKLTCAGSIQYKASAYDANGKDCDGFGDTQLEAIQDWARKSGSIFVKRISDNHFEYDHCFDINKEKPCTNGDSK